MRFCSASKEHIGIPFCLTVSKQVILSEGLILLRVRMAPQFHLQTQRSHMEYGFVLRLGAEAGTPSYFHNTLERSSFANQSLTLLLPKSVSTMVQRESLPTMVMSS